MINGIIGSFLALSQTNKIIMIIIWTIVVVGAIIIETETSELVSCWFAVGGLICLVLAFCGVEIIVQVVVFAISSALLVIATRPLLKKFTTNEDIPTNSDRLKGMVATVTKQINVGEKGEVKVNYQLWTAICKFDCSFNVGDKVIVKDIEGNKLIVEKIEEIEIE